MKLIPRMKAWVASEYPGTKTSMTEYNFGGLESINGALAQADVLGICGREGLDLATLWGAGSPSQPWAYAFRMFRNYDGNGHAFGSTSVRARSFDSSQPSRVNGGQDQLSVYAAQRSGSGALTVMVINKTAARSQQRPPAGRLRFGRGGPRVAIQRRRPGPHPAPVGPGRGRGYPQHDLSGILHHTAGAAAGMTAPDG